ncbi:hypothetical protein [Actinomycetospora sp. TBRC 11914]|uniref:hypothetical protein n=1 Tax=Actinomycetospora sp. TBRC 11914 TaxID=2729387 RepID=UPI00145CAC5F|nr:hypothetical protein [Actinomycetospora sp. TBRC 11914]NMO91739.1 hypothetical protein [Actinomycetospora sp. TBRC 11914]
MVTTKSSSSARQVPTGPSRYATLHIGVGRRASVFAVSGRVDPDTVRELRRRVRSHLTRGAGGVVVDVSASEPLTAAAYGGIVACAYDVVDHSGAPMRLVVDPARPAVGLSHLVGLGHLLALYESLTEACHPEPAPPLTTALTVMGTAL